ncbi:MAG TPA: ribonuclease H-like domain-containing protein [Pyrinomonadaceae bacterium]|jgi:DNA polymerase elongation subunit (family B)|nr:ribonuclease H-like domain-containing protein [Pyrinomonadaceae bacterium]
MKKIFLDIETLPPPNCGHETCNGHDPCQDEEYRSLSLKAEQGRVLCIGLVVEHNDTIIHQGVLGRDRCTLRFHLDEARTLSAFWKQFINFDPRRDFVIGHNIYDFDLLFLYKRSIIHQVKPPIMLSFARYRSQPIFDVMREWERWAFNRISLHDLAVALSLRSSKQNGLDGSRVYDYFMHNRHVEIADYCLRDVMLTREIYYRMQFQECVAKAS